MIITVRGDAELLDCDTDQAVVDAALLKRLDGVGDDYELAQYISPDAQPELHRLQLAKGDLRLRYEPASNRLFAESRFETHRQLDEPQLALITAFTRAQWSDGVGEHFDLCFKAGLPRHALRLRWDGALLTTSR